VDSLELYRRVIAPPLSREAGDELLRRILAWVGEAAAPSQVFAADRLELWAGQHGFARAADLERLATLCKDAATIVPGGTDLQVALMDAAYQYGARNPTT